MDKIKSYLEKMVGLWMEETVQKRIYEKARSLAISSSADYVIRDVQISPYIRLPTFECRYNAQGLEIDYIHSETRMYSENRICGNVQWDLSENLLVKKNSLVVYFARSEPFRCISLFRKIPVGKIIEYTPGSWTEELDKLYKTRNKEAEKRKLNELKKNLRI